MADVVMGIDAYCAKSIVISTSAIFAFAIAAVYSGFLAD